MKIKFSTKCFFTNSSMHSYACVHLYIHMFAYVFMQIPKSICIYRLIATAYADTVPQHAQPLYLVHLQQRED